MPEVNPPSKDDQVPYCPEPGYEPGYTPVDSGQADGASSTNGAAPGPTCEPPSASSSGSDYSDSAPPICPIELPPNYPDASRFGDQPKGIRYEKADIARGQIPSLAESIDPNNDGVLTQEEFNLHAGIYYGADEGFDPRKSDAPYMLLRTLAKRAETNPERMRKSLGYEQRYTKPYYEEGQQPQPPRTSRIQKYEEACALYAAIHLDPGAQYQKVKTQLIRASEIFGDLRYPREEDACYRLLLHLAQNEGNNRAALYWQAKSAFLHKRYDEARACLEKLPHDFYGAYEFKRQLGQVQAKYKFHLRYEQYLERTPDGRYTLSEKFQQLPATQRALILATIAERLVPETSGHLGALGSTMNGVMVEAERHLLEKFNTSTGAEKTYYDAKLHMVRGHYRYAHELYSALIKALPADHPIVARSKADLTDLEALHKRQVAIQLIQIDIFMNERSICAEEVGSSEYRLAGVRRRFLEKMALLIQTGEAQDIMTAATKARAVDLSGYEAWRSFSDELYYYSFNCAAVEGPHNPFPDPSIPRYETIFYAQEKLGVNNADELWLQRAHYLYKHGDFEGVRLILEKLLEADYESALQQVGISKREAITEKYGHEYRRELEGALWKDADTLREQIVATLRAQGKMVTVEDALVTDKLSQVIRENANLIIADKIDFGLHRAAWEFLAPKTDVTKRARALYFESFDPLDRWYQPTEENRRRLLKEAVISVPLIIAGGAVANIARAATMGFARAGIAVYVGEAALKLRSVRAGIYLAGMVGAGYTFHTTQSVLMTPLIGKRAWDNYWWHGLTASCMFGVLDAAKGGFRLIAHKGVEKTAQLFSVEAKTLLESRLVTGQLWAGELVTEAGALTGYSKILAMAEKSMPTDEAFLESYAHNLLMILELRAGGALAKGTVTRLLERKPTRSQFEEPAEHARDYNRTPLTPAQQAELTKLREEYEREVQSLADNKESTSIAESTSRVSELYERTLRAIARIIIPAADYQDLAVVMFGSAARREVNWDSDCDSMLLIKDAARLPKYRQYIVDMMEVAAEIGFEMETHLTVMALEGDALVPSGWYPQLKIFKNVKDALISPSQLTSLKLIDGDPAILGRFQAEVADPIVQDPSYISNRYEALILKNPALRILAEVLLTGNETKAIPMKHGVQRLLNCIAWIAGSRFRVDVKSTQEGLDLLFKNGQISQAEHLALSRLMMMVKYFRLFGQFDDTVSSEETTLEAMQEIADAYNEGELSAAHMRDIQEIFGIKPGRELKGREILQRLYNGVELARTVAERVRPVSVRVAETALKNFPRWAQLQAIRTRRWQLAEQYKLMREAMQKDGIDETTQAEISDEMDFYLKAFDNVMTEIQNGRTLSPNALRSLLLHAPTLIDSLHYLDLDPGTAGEKMPVLMECLLVDPKK